ncbi:MAG: hypothetical protein AAF430_18170 [Myxococcota bacterium]
MAPASDREPESQSENPSWLAALLSVIAGYHLLVWFVLLIVVSGAALVAYLKTNWFEHAAFPLLGIGAGLAFLFVWGYAIVGSTRLIRRFYRHLRVASPLAVVGWTALLASLFFVLPRGYVLQ